MSDTKSPQALSAVLDPVARFTATLGIPGPPGPQGEKGETGETGPPGPQGIEGPQGEAGVSSSVFYYRADAASTGQSDPGSGKIRWNAAPQTSATALYVDVLTTDGFDASLLFELAEPPARFVIHDKDLSQQYQLWEMTAPTIMYPDWFEVPVMLVETGGPSGGIFPNNTYLAALIQVQPVIGPEGEQGPPGVAGPQGIAGPQGVAGDDSTVEGPPGPQGIEGPPGTSINLQGTVATEDDLPVTGDPGDAWLTQDTDHLWVWDVSVWHDAGAFPQGPPGIQGIQGQDGVAGPAGPQGIQGIQGIQGPTGPQGIQGPAGTGINLKGTVATVGALPPNGNKKGDAYLVSSTGHLYIWSGSAWVDGGVVQGPPGPAGATGPAGPQGLTGVAGPQGVAGIQGVQGIQGVPGVEGPMGLTGPQGIQGIPGNTQPIRLGHTWGLVGDVTPLTLLPSIFVLERPGTQAAVLVGLRAKIASGTSIGVQVMHNGGGIGSVITVTTTAATTTFSVALADGDDLSLLLSSPVGTPTNLSATLILEHTP